jgi:phage FluMu protein Com
LYFVGAWPRNLGVECQEIPMVRCATCGLELVEKENLPGHERMPCPKCGSLERAWVKVQLETVGIDDRHRMKQKGSERTSSGRIGRELTQGDDYHKRSGVWNYLYRLIDRTNDWYHEKITDLRTGRTIRECKEPLSKHTERGSARKKK